MKKLIFVFLLLMIPLSSALSNLDVYAYYNLDELTGTNAIDVVTGKFNATNTGATTGIDGIINESYMFDGTDDGLDLPNNMGIFNDGNFTINMWFNTSGLFDNDVVISLKGEVVLEANAVTDSRIRFEGIGSVGGRNAISTELQNDTWYMLTFMQNASGFNFFVNGVLNATSTNPGNLNADTGNSTMFVDGTHTRFMEGMLDEISFFNESLDIVDIVELYNSGAGKAYPFDTIIITTLEDPADDSIINVDPYSFNASYVVSGTATNLTNATTYIWYGNGSLFDTNYSIINGTTNSTAHLMGNFVLGNYDWNVLTCGTNGTGICSWAASNSSFFWGFDTENTTFSYPVLESTVDTFQLNMTLPTQVSVQSAILSYNGTNYTNADKLNFVDNNWSVTKSITILPGTPGFGAENRTFYWVVTLSDLSTGLTTNLTTAVEYQDVRELTLRFCDSINTIPVLNFTMFDELNGLEINATSNATNFEGTFSYGASLTSRIKNYSFTNLSMPTNEFDFCTNLPSAIIYTDFVSEYSAVDYSPSNHFLTNAVLTNVTNEISLFLLRDDAAVQFFITVTLDFAPLDGATVNIDKFFIGEGVFKTVEIDETDITGRITAYLELDQEYRFVVQRDGTPLGIKTKTSYCEAAPCTIEIELLSESADVFSGFNTAFAQNVLYNLSYDTVTKMVTFDFIDLTGLATSFKMEVSQNVINQSQPIIIYSNRVFTSSGTMTFNATNLNNGEYIVNTYIARSPDQFIGFIMFIISSVSEALGLLGIIIALLLVLVIALGVALNPFMFIFAVPLGLTIAKMTGLIYLTSAALTGIYILSIIAVIAMGKK